MKKIKRLKEKIKKADKKREGGIFYKTERKIIERWVSRLPGFLTPDRLTLISVVSAILVGISYYLTNFSKWWLIGSCIFLFLNWFGDSFDGEVARYRRIQRPRYGYYVDHFSDAFAVTAMLFGLGLSPLLKLPIALGLIIFYLLLLISTALAVYTQGKYKIAYCGFGGTEGRIILFGFSMVSLFLPKFPFYLFNIKTTQITLFDFAGIVCLFFLFYMLVVCVVENLKYLNKIDKKSYKEMSLKELLEKSAFLARLKEEGINLSQDFKEEIERLLES
ncbi:MAG: CDP-alcohol phosphatidyltransferase family protein [Candidatus Pacearchaeota archaeon]